MPAIYALATRHLLPSRYAIVGVARTEGSDDSFREDMKQAVQQHARDDFRQDVWDELAAAMHYVSTDFADEGGENALATVDGARRGAAGSAATASTTSPSRRPRSRRSSRRSASGGRRRAGRA